MQMVYWNLTGRQDRYSRINGLRLVIKLVLFVLIILVTGIGAPLSRGLAQSTSQSAEINKSFSPISIIAGDSSRMSVTIFNPNPFQLNNASWTDNLPAGMTLANPVNAATTCGGIVTAVAGGNSIEFSGGTVPAQAGGTPGACTVSVDVTSTTPGNLVNTIRQGV